MRLNKALESLTAYKAGPPLRSIRDRYGIDRVVMLGANECPEGPFPEVIQALESALPSLNRYPEGGCDDLRAALAERLGVPGDRLVFGNGSCELLMLLGETLVAPGEHMVFAEPSFVVYETIALTRQASFDAIPLREHVHDLEAMAAAVRPDTRLVIACEPNNPTGTYVGPEALRRFLAAVPSETVVVLDEAYTEYVTHPEHVDTIPWMEEYENLVVLRTFSKIYGLAGLRIGYGLFPSNLVAALDKLRQPYNVTSLAQVAALEALRHPARVQERRAHVQSERGRLARELALLGVRTVPSQANFLLANVEGLTVPAEDVPQTLLEKGVVVRSGWGVGCPGWIRVTLGTVEENDLFLQTMRDMAGKEGLR